MGHTGRGPWGSSDGPLESRPKARIPIESVLPKQGKCLSAFTPYDKLKAIAEKAGWKNVHVYSDNSGPDIICGDPPFKLNKDWEVIGQHSRAIPDFLSDLNAIHEAIKYTFDTEQAMRKYVDWLVTRMAPGEFTVNATAIQRADAFLLACGIAQDELNK